MMRISSMNVPMLLQAQSLVADGEGGHISQWSTIAALWGALARRRDSGDLTAPETGKATHDITVRKRTDIVMRPAQRLVYEERIFTIHRVDPHERDPAYLVLVVHEQNYLN